MIGSAVASAVLADSDSDKGSPIGLFIVLLLLVAVYFLYRSMNGHIRRLPADFPADAVDNPDSAAKPGAVAPADDQAKPDTTT